MRTSGADRVSRKSRPDSLVRQSIPESQGPGLVKQVTGLDALLARKSYTDAPLTPLSRKSHPESPMGRRSPFLAECSSDCDCDDDDVDFADEETSLHLAFEKLEKAMGDAYREQRARMEEILGKNQICLKRIEAAYELKLSQLKAENTVLREKCGITAEQGHGSRHSRVRTVQQLQRGASKGSKWDLDRGMSGFMRSQTKALDGAKTAPTEGMWQHIVAWVPVGTKLLQPNGEWKPPHNMPGMEKHAHKSKRKKSRSASEAASDFHPVLPGAANVGSAERGAGLKSAATFCADEDEDDADECFAEPLVIAESLKPSRKEMRQSLQLAGDNDGSSLFPSICSSESAIVEYSSRCTIHPGSTVRIIWDLCSLVLVVYDMVSIPLQFFNLEDVMFFTVCNWCSRVFWTSDIIASCITGVIIKDGSVRMDVLFIIKRYVRTWLGLDLLIVGSDWLEFAVQGTGGLNVFAKLGRASRLVRIVRLLRLARMKTILEQATERIQSDNLVFAVNSMLMLLGVLATSHLLGCVWFGLGIGVVHGDNWVHEFGFRTKPVEAQYLVSLHWALSQFTGGMDEVHPANVTERLYTVFVWTLTFGFAAFILSIMTSNLTQIKMIGGGRSRQLALLRKFLRQNNVSRNLALRMQRNAKHALSTELTEDTVELLPVIASSLRVEMHFELFSRELNQHAYLSWYMQEAISVMRKVCHHGMSVWFVSEGDTIFSRGDTPKDSQMYYVSRGMFTYEISYEEDIVAEPEVVLEKKWVGEPALWVESWIHRGTFRAKSEGKLTVLDVGMFQELVGRSKDTATAKLKVYAMECVARMNEHLAVVNDLRIPTEMMT